MRDRRRQLMERDALPAEERQPGRPTEADRRTEYEKYGGWDAAKVPRTRTGIKLKKRQKEQP